MRFRAEVSAVEPQIPWSQVHTPARAVLYSVIRSQDEDLAAELHDRGWAGSSLRPVGICPPVFRKNRRGRGGYSTSQWGWLRLGSPVPRIAACLLGGLALRQEVRWGEVRLVLGGVQPEPAPDHGSGTAVFATASPVLVKRDSRYLLPDEAGYVERLVHNLRHKADVLGLPNDVEVEVLDAGPRRRFDTGQGFRIGARVTARVSASPLLLDALYDWGLGLQTNLGFGWVK